MKFKYLSLEDRGTIVPYLKSKEQKNCVFSFGNNILWNPAGGMEYAVCGDVLVYRTVYPDTIRYCVPDFRQKWGEIIEAIAEDAARQFKSYRISSLTQEDRDQILRLDGSYQMRWNRDQSDYIYLVDEIARFPGAKYEKKRNLVNYFQKHYSWEYEPLQVDNRIECLEYEEIWLRNKIENCNISKRELETLYLEKEAISLALDHFEELGFEGGILRVNGQCIAFAMGEELGNDIFVQHFEKADDRIKGAYQMIFQQFVQKTLQKRYKYINREEDMGNENIRFTKLSYFPCEIVHKYALFRE